MSPDETPPLPPTGAPRDLRRELATLLRLAVPVTAAQLGMMAMGLVDTLMVGHVSKDALAAVALGNLYSFGMHAFGFGALLAVDPLVAQAVGAEDLPAFARSLQRGLALALLLALPTSLLLLVAAPVLQALGQPEALVPVAAGYSRITLGGAPAFFAFIVLRQSLQALHRTGAIVAAVLVANVANAALNWMLVFGRAGAPELGPLGCAWATVASRWILFGVALLVAWREMAPHLRPIRREALQPRALASLLRLGVPIGGQFVLEIGMFSAVALFMGWLGTREIASHQVALSLAAFSFMVPLGVSAAGAVRVGNAIGRGDGPLARRAAALALAVGGGFMLLSAGVFVAVPEALARAFTSDRDVVELAAVLIRIAAVFQVFDGLQVVAIGVLRGAGDTRTPVIVNVVGFVGLGLPLALALGFAAGAGAEGLWWGLVASLACVALVLLFRVRERLGGELSRLEIDG